MRIVFMGCVEFSHSTLKHVLSLKEAQVVGIVTLTSSTVNADFCSLAPLAETNNIPCFYYSKDRESHLLTWLKDLKPDVVYCFGWSSLLKKEVLEVPRLGVIGYHPAALPKNRGRHPLIWALALGLKHTASTFFFMDEGADSGDILSQKKITITPNDNALTLYKKVTEVSLNQISEFTSTLADGTFRQIPQDHSQANSWRKRGKKDGEIDWRMSAKSINNLVRALTKPYVGAHCLVLDQEVKIWETALGSGTFENIEPGKVLNIQDPKIVVKCGEGILEILKHEFKFLPKEGDYL